MGLAGAIDAVDEITKGLHFRLADAQLISQQIPKLLQNVETNGYR